MLKKETQQQDEGHTEEKEKSLKESFDEINSKETKKEEKKSVETTKELTNSELKDLIEKNIKWSQVIYNQNKKINRRLTWMVVGSYLRLALIVVPLILGIIYLPPLIIEFVKNYGETFGIDANTLTQFGDLLKQGNAGQMDPSQIQELIKQYQ